MGLFLDIGPQLEPGRTKMPPQLECKRAPQLVEPLGPCVTPRSRRHPKNHAYTHIPTMGLFLNKGPQLVAWPDRNTASVRVHAGIPVGGIQQASV